MKFKGENIRVKKENSLYNETHLLKYFKNKNDAKYYSRGSDRYIDCVCPICKYEKKVRAHNLYNNGFSCPYCKDYMSYPERFIYSYLKTKDIEFEHQYKLHNKNRFIDFYLPKLNIAIETHGEQHYTNNISSNWVDSYKNTKQSDEEKRQYCEENNIKLVELDCSKSYFKYIEDSIKESILPSIDEKEKESILELIIEGKDMNILKILEDYKKGINAFQISKKYNVDPGYVITLAKRYNIYDKYYKDGRGTLKFYCFETNKEYKSMAEVKRSLNIATLSHIKEVAEGKREFCKNREGKKYTFKFI